MITDQEGLTKLYLETFMWRLRDRPIRPDLVELQELKNSPFETILKNMHKEKSLTMDIQRS